MKKYKLLKITVISFQEEDVIRTSSTQELSQPVDNATFADIFTD